MGAGRRREGLLALAGYLCLSAAVFGHGALAHLQGAVLGFGPRGYHGRDQSAYVWFLDWGARALTHLENPLSSAAIFAPHGYNLAWAASIQGPSLVMAPVTLLAGPVASFNLLAIAAPATAAWTAYLLCRALVAGGPWPAIAGGLLFGFSTYETVEMVNHVNLALVALVPLAVLLTVRRVTGAIPRWAFVGGLAVVLAAQLWTSTEVLASMVMFGTLAFLLALVAAGPRRRRAVIQTAGEALAAMALAAVLGAPFLYHAFRYPDPVQGISGAASGIDVANLLTPTRVTWLQGIPGLRARATALQGNITEQTAYLGVPLLLLLAAAAWSFRRRAAGAALAAFVVITLVASMGSHLIETGHRTALSLPWAIVGQLPLMRFAIPGRFVVYLWLAVALAAAAWLAAGWPSSPLLRWSLFAVVAASLAPNPLGVPWSTRVDSPALMKDPQLTRYVGSGATVLALPFGASGDSMFWQVQAGFHFRLAGGYVSVSLPAEYRPEIYLVHALQGNPFSGNLTPRLCDFLRMTGSSVILLRDGRAGYWQRLLGPLGITPLHAGGFRVYRLAGSLCARRRMLGGLRGCGDRASTAHSNCSSRPTGTPGGLRGSSSLGKGGVPRWVSGWRAHDRLGTVGFADERASDRGPRSRSRRTSRDSTDRGPAHARFRGTMR